MRTKMTYGRTTCQKLSDLEKFGLDCDVEARGETEQEVVNKCAEHGRTAHGMQILPQELVQKVRAAIAKNL